MNPIKRKLKDWYVWRFSGLITVSIVLTAIVLGVYFQTQSLEFFHTWSCDDLIQYKTDLNVYSNIIPYEQLTVEQVEKFENTLKECENFEMFKP